MLRLALAPRAYQECLAVSMPGLRACADPQHSICSQLKAESAAAPRQTLLAGKMISCCAGKACLLAEINSVAELSESLRMAQSLPTAKVHEAESREGQPWQSGARVQRGDRQTGVKSRGAGNTGKSAAWTLAWCFCPAHVPATQQCCKDRMSWFASQHGTMHPVKQHRG